MDPASLQQRPIRRERRGGCSRPLTSAGPPAKIRRPRAVPPSRADVAQLVRALDCGSRGPQFKSGHRYHLSIPTAAPHPPRPEPPERPPEALSRFRCCFPLRSARIATIPPRSPESHRSSLPFRGQILRKSDLVHGATRSFSRKDRRCARCIKVALSERSRWCQVQQGRSLGKNAVVHGASRSFFPKDRPCRSCI